jgi:hypothetical protein
MAETAIQAAAWYGAVEMHDLLLARKGGGGSNNAAIHLATLLGRSVAGNSPHGGFDPDHRGDKHNLQELKAFLETMKGNMRRGQTLQDFLAKQGWNETQIKDFVDSLNKVTEKYAGNQELEELMQGIAKATEALLKP